MANSFTLQGIKTTSRIIQYFNNKLEGGEINQRGNKYENTFALSKVIYHLGNSMASASNILFSSQVSAFIDDLFIQNKLQKEFYQLKTSQALKWGKYIGSLKFDFSYQRKIEAKNKSTFKFYLITAHRSVETKMTTTMPRNLQSETSIEYFPYYESVSLQIANDTGFRKSLEKICAFSATDKLNSLANCIMGIWESSDKKNIQLSDIFLELQNINASFLNTGVFIDINIALRNLLINIPGFKYNLKNGYLSWEYGPSDKGDVPYRVGTLAWYTLEGKILAANPTTFTQLEPLLV